MATKVTTISEKKSLSSMTSATLFGKLQEYETELGRLENHKNQEKKSKNTALKIDSKEVEKEDNSEEDENFMLLVKRLGKFFCRNDKSFSHSKGKKQFKKKEASTSTQEVTCMNVVSEVISSRIVRNSPRKVDTKENRDSRTKRIMLHGRIMK